MEIGSAGRICAAVATCRARSVRTAYARGSTPDSRCQTAVGPRRRRVPGNGEQPAKRRAASQSMVTESTVGPERGDVVANVSWTSGPTAEPRWLGNADQRKRRFTAGRLFRWKHWSSKAARRQSLPEAHRNGRVQGCRGGTCPIGEGSSSKNRPSQLAQTQRVGATRFDRSRTDDLRLLVLSAPANPGRARARRRGSARPYRPLIA